MSNITRLSVLLCGLLIVGVGCRGKEPAAPPTSKTSEGPLLVPPQESAPAAPPQGDHTAIRQIGGRLA